ncbi:MAG: 6-phosphogluconolactonase [Candidatus Dormibacteria bacterium]
MRLILSSTRDDLDRFVADWIQASAIRSQFLALAVGNSVTGAYRTLAARPGCLDSVSVCSLDELYPLDASDPRGFGARLIDELGDHTGAELHRFDSRAVDPDAEASRMEKLVLGVGLAAAVLGLGPNGHLAFNEPGVPFTAASRRARLSIRTVQHLGGRGAIAPAREGMTLGLPALLQARRLLLVVVGQKHGAMKRLLVGPVTRTLPASVLRLHSDVTVVTTERQLDGCPPEVVGLLKSAPSVPVYDAVISTMRYEGA